MAVAEINNLVIDKGEDFDATFTIYNEDGTKLGFNTSFTGVSKLRKYPSSPKQYSFNVTLNNNNSSVTISMASTITSELPSGRCYYDVMITSGQTPQAKKYVTGTLIVRDTAAL